MFGGKMQYGVLVSARKSTQPIRVNNRRDDSDRKTLTNGKILGIFVIMHSEASAGNRMSGANKPEKPE